MSDGPAPTANAAPPRGRAPVRRHHWIVRVTHWATLLLVTGMVASGLQIYEAYARFGNRGGRLFPSPFDGAQFPHWSRLGGWLAGALNWHFALMWPLVTVGLLYLGYLAKSGEWRALLFRPRDVRGAIDMTRYYLRLRPDHPPARCDLRSRLPRLRQPEHQEHPLARTDRFRCPHERSVPAHVLHDSRHLSLHPGRAPQPYQRLERARESVAQPPAVALPPLTAHATLVSS